MYGLVPSLQAFLPDRACIQSIQRHGMYLQAASALGLPGPRQSLAVQVEGNACSVLLPHSVCVPCSATQVFTTVRNGQTQVCTDTAWYAMLSGRVCTFRFYPYSMPNTAFAQDWLYV